jgi:hypothetical protein
MRYLGLISISIGIVTATLPLLSQTPSTQKPSFEVASIKPTDPAQLRNGVYSSGGLAIRGRCHGIDSKFPADDIGNSIH